MENKTITISEKQYLELTRMAFEDLNFNCKNRNWLNHNKKHFTNKNIYLAVIDLNNLKQVNDQMGHEKGDEYMFDCLKKIRAYFEDLGQPCEIVRFGGDEFLVISEKEITKKLVDTIKYFAACGISQSKEHENIFYAMKKADKLMYINKFEYKKKCLNEFMDGVINLKMEG